VLEKTIKKELLQEKGFLPKPYLIEDDLYVFVKRRNKEENNFKLVTIGSREECINQNRDLESSSYELLRVV